MTSNRNVIAMVALVLLMLLVSPVSFADRQDPDMADRIYEKFKEREQQKRTEKQTRGSKERSDNADRSSDQRKSAKATRDSGDRSTTNSRSEGTERRSSRDSDYRSSDSDERSSRQAGEQLSRQLRDLINRKSQRQQSSEPSSRNSYTRGNNSRSSMDSGALEVRERVSLDQAVNIVRRQSNGKVISARSEGSGATRKHRIKVLIDERRVRTYVVSATTGKVY